MANWHYYDSKPIAYITILYKILLAFSVVIVILLFTLKIEDSVYFKEGEVYSTNPQIKLNTPSEVKVLTVNVAEGQSVKQGDTLFVLENPRLEADYKVNQQDIQVISQKIKIADELTKNAHLKNQYLKELGQIQHKIYSTDKTKTEQEIKNLQKKIAITDQESHIVIEKYKSDSLLYTQGAISRIEATQAKERNLVSEKQQIEGAIGMRQRLYDYDNLKNNYEKTTNGLLSEINGLESQMQNLRREKFELLTLLNNKQFENKYLANEIKKLLVIAPINGTVSNLYNSKQTLTQLNKGELLAIVAPTKETFFVKVILPERDLIYVKKSQTVNLKLDAFHYYKFGVLRGTVNYVSPSDINKTFFTLVNLGNYNSQITLKAGYKVKGDIVIEKMILAEYIIKKLFNKFDNNL
jgi:multidrug efflux pump subunit AcrA (membrane-fusion protein)